MEPFHNKQSKLLGSNNHEKSMVVMADLFVNNCPVELNEKRHLAQIVSHSYCYSNVEVLAERLL
jgi:hypothetical protein